MQAVRDSLGKAVSLRQPDPHGESQCRPAELLRCRVWAACRWLEVPDGKEPIEAADDVAEEHEDWALLRSSDFSMLWDAP